jgi:drug/metabolite transporter (DMT)-like permease
MGPTEWGLIALQAMFWGSTFFFIAIARKSMPPFTLSVIRLLPALALLLVVTAAMGLRLPASAPEWRRLLVFAALNNAIPFYLIIQAQQEVSGGVAAIVMAMGPLWALLLAPWFIADERYTWARFVGILVGVLGVAVITGAGGSAGTLGALGLLVLGTFCFASANIYARRFLGGYHPFVVALCQIIGALVLTAPLMLVFERPWSLPAPGGGAWAAMLAMGLLGSGLAPLCHFTVLKRAGAVNGMLSAIVVPITPALLGVAFLGEKVAAKDISGAVLIATGLLIIDGRPLAWARRTIVGKRA